MNRLWAGALVVALLVAACASTSRPETLRELGSTTIVPTYEQLAADGRTLADATDALCEEPTLERLDDSRAALRATRSSWSRSTAMWVGPVMDRRSWARVDWPVADAEIEALVGGDGDLGLERIGKQVGADQRGLGAAEYLLGQPGDVSTLDELADDRRCRYLTSIAAVIADEADSLLADWTIGFDGGLAFIEVIGDEETGALDDLVNDAVFLLEAMSDAELGVALGEREGDADIEAIVEGPSALGVDDLRDRLGGLRAVLVADDVGLSRLLDGGLHERLVESFDAAERAVADVSPPLREAVVDRTETVAAARDALKDLQVLVTTEVVSQLGVTIGFSDADGDTGS